MADARQSRLWRALRRSDRLCVGVLSGTSVDAAEAAVCRIKGSGHRAHLELLAHVSVPFAPALVGRVLGAKSVRDVCELNFLLGAKFAQAVERAVAQAGLRNEDIDVVGSHGQTLAHLPPGFSTVPSTLQVGEASVIRERTGIPTVCDFRVRDVSAGGQGAPLVPYADWVLFRPRRGRRALQNIGGIANLSVVGARLEDTRAFDSGPGNMLLDALARRISGGKAQFDRDGRMAARGEVLGTLLAELLRHPFLRKRPPRSAGRELFGEALVSELWSRYQRRPYDLMATAVAFTVEATARAYEKWVLPDPELDGVYVSGGGSRNPVLMAGLVARLSPLPVRPLDVLGFPEPAKEAACFALLASEWLSQAAQNVPSATGARSAVVLGKMVP